MSSLLNTAPKLASPLGPCPAPPLYSREDLQAMSPEDRERYIVSAYIGRNIHLARLARGLERAELGEELGHAAATARSVLQQLEDGKKAPSCERLFNYAAALAVHPADLLDDQKFVDLYHVPALAERPEIVAPRLKEPLIAPHAKRPRWQPETTSDRELILRMVGNNIRVARLARGMKSKDLGRKLGASPGLESSMVTQIEKGVAGMAFPKLFEIARALEIHPADLLDPDMFEYR